MGRAWAFLAGASMVCLISYGLIQYGRILERTDNLQAINELQLSMAALGMVIAEQEGIVAEKTRKAIESERGRLDAIKTTDHQSEKIRRLERSMREALDREKENRPVDGGVPDNLNYRVIITDAIQRVYDAARDCELPESEFAGVFQKRLHEITGDDVSELIKKTAGAYCGCGIQYNALWRSCERIIKAQQKSPG